VRHACQRHLDDLSSGKQRGLIWDGAAALHAIDFFGHLRHSTGEWAHRPFVLQPWQDFVIGSLFGWKRADGLQSWPGICGAGAVISAFAKHPRS
jgi:phage terminase large subunit-like protein